MCRHVVIVTLGFENVPSSSLKRNAMNRVVIVSPHRDTAVIFVVHTLAAVVAFAFSSAVSYSSVVSIRAFLVFVFIF